jgi:hypothetical protein
MLNIRARALVREATSQELTFELIEIDHSDRNRLRRQLASLSSKEN